MNISSLPPNMSVFVLKGKKKAFLSLEQLYLLPLSFAPFQLIKPLNLVAGG